jgi:hypothetical protein
MASTHSMSYPLGGTQTELQRLLAQAQAYEPESNWLLDQCGIQLGWHTVDVGCGPIGILNLLSQRVGPHGSLLDVSALDEHREALLRHLNDPATIVIDRLFVQSWGQKPG